MEHLEIVKQKFDRIIEYLKEEFSGIRTNRPTPKLIEDVSVDYMEQSILVKQLGSISVEAPRDLIINVWDQNAVPSIASAIESANLGVGVSVQGKTVRVALPDLTEERKRELIKIAKSTSEDGRIKMRRDRDEVAKKFRDLKDEDERFRAKEDLQKLVDNFNGQVDQLLEKKTKDILD